MHEPQYIELSDIPVQIPDDYSDKQKHQAIEVAEAEIELDLNDGKPLHNIPEELMPKVRVALKQKATSELAEGAEDPDDVTLGDLSDGGTNKEDYAEIFNSQYEKLVVKIRNSDALEDDKDDSAYVYNTRTGSDRNDTDRSYESDTTYRSSGSY